MPENQVVTDWLLSSAEPWTRLRTRVDLLEESDATPDVQTDRMELYSHPLIKELIEAVQPWGETPITRHNDAGHAVQKLILLADFGIQIDAFAITEICQRIMAHQSDQGFFQSMVTSPAVFGGTGESTWTWMMCDAPTLIYCLLAMGCKEDPRVETALKALVEAAEAKGYLCKADPAFGKFRGPGKKSDPCPIANLLALRAFSQVPETWGSPAVQNSAEMLLAHWNAAPGTKYYLFGVGSSFRKLKAPLIWYDLLHVCDVLTRFPFLHDDPRLQSMACSLLAAGDDRGFFTATSMYQSWKGWSFADKKNPSPWLTILACRIRKRMRNYL
jgi:hypothetical protein